MAVSGEAHMGKRIIIGEAHMGKRILWQSVGKRIRGSAYIGPTKRITAWGSA